MIEIVVMNHAVSFADLAPESARSNVNGRKLFGGATASVRDSVADASLSKLTIKPAHTSAS